MDESRMLAMQLDTELIGLEPYRALALSALDGTSDPGLGSLRSVITGWNGRADADQPAVALLSAFQRSIERRFAAMLVAWMRAKAGQPLPGLEIRAVHDEPWLRVLETNEQSPRIAVENDGTAEYAEPLEYRRGWRSDARSSLPPPAGALPLCA